MRLAYLRVSAVDQSPEAQRAAMRAGCDREFVDTVSGAIPFERRPAAAQLLSQVRPGDVVYVAAVDRLGRDAIDIQVTVRRLIDAGVAVEVEGLGQVAGEAGRLVLAVLAQMAEADRARIRERTAAGRAAARQALAATGRTHHGKESLGRPRAASPAEVVAWRQAHRASIQDTARHFEISPATVKRYQRAAHSQQRLG